MYRIPKEVRKLFEEVSKEFSASVWKRFVQLIMAAIILRGRKSIWRLLYCSGIEMTGHFSTYHRIFSHRRWSAYQRPYVIVPYSQYHPIRSVPFHSLVQDR